MIKSGLSVLFCLLAGSMNFVSARQLNSSGQHSDSLKSMRYIHNGQVKVGIDLYLGGAITYLADPKKGVNLINNKDLGRQVQMSFYSGPVPYEPDGKKASPDWTFIGWNPIQSGDVAGNHSRIIAQKNTATTMYVKCIPMHWPLNNVPGECIFESWISLKENTVQVHGRLTNMRDDTTQYMAREQELPAVYTNAPWHRLVSYRGDKPFTHDTVSIISNHNYPGNKNIQWAHFSASENWAANLDGNNYGLGVFNPEVESFQGGYYGDSTYKGDSKSGSTAYIAPGNIEVLDHNIVYDYTYTLILGTLKEIRNYAFMHVNRHKLPAYNFVNTRSHWYYENTTDGGWPVKNQLVIKLSDQAAMLGPLISWRAEDAPALNFNAVYSGSARTARVYWKGFNKKFEESSSLEFDVISDNKPHSYHILLNKATGYKGTLDQLRIKLDAAGTSMTGDRVMVSSISLSQYR